jgi:hypothetical protein
MGWEVSKKKDFASHEKKNFTEFKDSVGSFEQLWKSKYSWIFATAASFY